MTDVTMNKEIVLKELLEDVIKTREILAHNVLFAMNLLKEMETAIMINRVKTDSIFKLLNEEQKQSNEEGEDD